MSLNYWGKSLPPATCAGKGAPSPGLVDFLAAHPDLPGETVCVPGGGTGHDAGEWAKAGFASMATTLRPVRFN